MKITDTLKILLRALNLSILVTVLSKKWSSLLSLSLIFKINLIANSIKLRSLMITFANI